MTKEAIVPLISGAMAGMCVDLTLFPIDTIKTRLQSDAGFWRSGGFRHIYSGLMSTMIGSAPNAAIFFLSYETSKSSLKSLISTKYEPIVHMMSASVGEVTACLVRVPVEVIKQRAQASQGLIGGQQRPQTSGQIFRQTISREGFRGLYRGYLSTIVREIPFSLIQFPVWEYLKKRWIAHQNHQPLNAIQSTVCGAVAGGCSALLTTPLDLAKTRIMLAETGAAFSIRDIAIVLKMIYTQNGVFGLFTGAVPRVVHISIGGAIFLGGYDIISNFLHSL
ncbi:S-adenosylmethionine mitochondrial carrier protein-like [Oppia nitens]|uniref:S-adenosylmethionine mitochondrial carrier protein-like n=1 Tax=Oppia nitens TaxID=1686743 RepID=UPI0023DC886C|nr:S-adenosylmethionine mitochondrial carrier protein-like [Oppia nitens]